MSLLRRFRDFVVPTDRDVGIFVTGQFSILFPKTFEYLKTYTLAKYSDFHGELPDVKVVIRKKNRTDQVFEYFEGLIAGASYDPTGKLITVFVDYLSESEEVSKRLFEDPNLLCRYLDTLNPLRSTLIHEYQHAMQFFLSKTPLKSSVDIPEALKKRNNKEKILQYISVLAKRTPTFGLFGGVTAGVLMGILSPSKMTLIGSVLGPSAVIMLSKAGHYTLSKLFPKEAALTSTWMLYVFDPNEIEAQIAEKIYWTLLGKDPSEVSPGFRVTEQRLKANVEALQDGIAEQKELYDRAEKKDKDEIKARIQLMQKILYRQERSLNLIPVVNEEVKRIADQVKLMMSENPKDWV